MPSHVGSGTWIVLPTYNEAENLGPISLAILEALPQATLLIVDDGSPDGTGRIADERAGGAGGGGRPGRRQAPGLEAGPRSGLSRRLRDGAGGRRERRRADGRRLVAR